MNEEKLLNDLMVNLTTSSCALNKTLQDGILTNNQSDIIFTTSEGNKIFISYIPYEDEEGKNIDLRIRKRLALEFINKYSLEFLKNEYEQHINSQIKKQEKAKIDYDHLYNFKNEIESILNRFSEIEVKQYSNFKSEIAARFNYIAFTYKRESEHEEILINKQDGKIIVNYSKVEKEGYNHSTHNYIFNTTLEFKEFINNLYLHFDELLKSANAKLDILKEKEVREQKANTLCWNIAHSNTWYILKSKKIYTAICSSTKYSLTSGIGKYYTPNYNRLQSDLIEGKIEGYYICDGIKASDVEFKNVSYISI